MDMVRVMAYVRNNICIIYFYYILYLPKCIGARALLRHCTVAASEYMGLEHRSSDARKKEIKGDGDIPIL